MHTSHRAHAISLLDGVVSVLTESIASSRPINVADAALMAATASRANAHATLELAEQTAELARQQQLANVIAAYSGDLVSDYSAYIQSAIGAIVSPPSDEQ